MYGDKEIQLSVDVIPNVKQLLNDIDDLLKNASSLEERHGIIYARTLIQQAVQTEKAKQIVSADILQQAVNPDRIMTWTIEDMTKTFQKTVLQKFPVVVTVYTLED